MITKELASMMNPMTRSVHGNPSLWRSCCATSGNTIPPVDVPDATKAMARVLFLEK